MSNVLSGPTAVLALLQGYSLISHNYTNYLTISSISISEIIKFSHLLIIYYQDKAQQDRNALAETFHKHLTFHQLLMIALVKDIFHILFSHIFKSTSSPSWYTDISSTPQMSIIYE